MNETSPPVGLPPSMTFVLAPSSKSNSLGRGICMAMIAAEIGDVELWASDDGPIWIAAPKFGVEVNLFTVTERDRVVARITRAAQSGPVVVWVSKGLHPLDLMATEVAGHPNVTVVQDFDEDDLALMQQHVRGSVRRASQFPPYHPRSPLRVKRSQARAARAADAVSYTSDAIRDVYERRGVRDTPSARIPHVRAYLDRDKPPVREEGRDSQRPVLAFLGSIRPHKGVDHIVRLADEMPEARFVSFAQKWRPPESLRDRWVELPADQPIVDAYRGVDALLVPQDLTSAVAQTQLSAKILDAAVMGRAIIGSPSKTLEEYCSGSYVPVDDWTRPEAVARSIRESDLESLGSRLRDIYDAEFNPQSAALHLRELLERARR